MMGKPYEDEEIDELEADDGQDEEEEDQHSEIEEAAADGAGSGGSAATTVELLDDRSVASRQALRDEMERQVAEFLARGGRIQEVEADITADPPRKPTSDYGSRPI
jgi:hypothetical protein